MDRRGLRFVLLSVPGKLVGEYNWLVRHRFPDTSGELVRVHSSRTWRFQLSRRMPSPLIVTYDSQLAPLADYGPLGIPPETLAELRATPLDTHALLGVLGNESRFDVVQSVWRSGNDGFIAVTSTEQLGPRNAAAISLVEVVMVERAAIRDVDSWTVISEADPRLRQCR